MVNKYRQFSKANAAARRRDKMCGQKRAYATAEDAYQKGVNVYECPYCHRWHRTHAPATLAVRLAKAEKGEACLFRENMLDK